MNTIAAIAAIRSTFFDSSRLDKMRFKVNPIFSITLLYLSQTFFLWMFFSSEGLEVMAMKGWISGLSTHDAALIAMKFASDWRHGMTSGWLLYMPGFFASAIATWLCSETRPLRRVITEITAVTLLAALTASLLAPAGSLLVIESFHRETGFSCRSESAGQSVIGTFRGLLTLVFWSSLVICGQRGLIRRSLNPLVIPAGLGLLLAGVRPVTVDDLTVLWIHRVIAGDVVAIISLTLMPCTATLLIWRQRRIESEFQRLRLPKPSL